MKKLIVFLVFALVAMNFASANNISVPKKVTDAFASKYPSAEKTTWNEGDGTYQATFTDDGNQVIAVFEESGVWVQSITNISEDDLLENITTYLTDEYDSYDIVSAQMIETEDDTTYEISIEVGEDEESEEEEEEEEEGDTNTIELIFDEEGNLIK